MVFKYFIRIYKLLPSGKKLQIWLLLGFMTFMAFSETATAGLIALMASSITDPDLIYGSSYYLKMQELLNIEYIRETSSLVLTITLLVTSMMFIKNGLTALMQYLIARFSAYTDGRIGGILLDRFLNAPYEWHLHQNSADLVFNIERRQAVGSGFVTNLLNVAVNAMTSVFLISALVIVEPIISAVVLVILGAMGLIVYLNSKRYVIKYSELSRDAKELINRRVNKSLHGIKDVKIFQKKQAMNRDFHDGARASVKYDSMLRLFMTSPALVLEFAGALMLLLSIYIMIFQRGASMGMVSATLALLVVTAWKLLPAVNKILSGFINARDYMTYAIKIFEYLDELEGKRSADALPEPGGSDLLFGKEVELNEASFQYLGKDSFSLEGVSFSFHKGESIGVIGGSGAGKSTLVDLLIGLLPLAGGRVLVDGKVMDKTNVHAWLRLIGYVPQTPYIYDGTLAQNIAFGLCDDEIDRDLVMQCCKMAAIDDFLKELPNGLDTPIGERGARLSGGQRQRVAIARALYKKPEILIFDEATSALDHKNEEAIQNTIHSLSKSRTLIIIAHRLSTVEWCDKLIWMDKGSIKMAGPPESVLGAYVETPAQ